MKYTKYSYKKSTPKKSSIVPTVIITVLSICIGLCTAWIVYSQFFLDNNPDGFIQTDVNPGVIDKDGNLQTGEEANYIFIQSGYFANKDNANASYDLIDDEFLAFMVEDDNKFRVSAGIYSLDEGTKKMEELKSKGIEVSKMDFYIPNDNEINKQVLSIIDAYTKLIKNLNGEDVKYITTKDFKEYINNLEILSTGDKIEVLNELKKHAGELPQEMTKDDVKKEMGYIFQILINYRK